MVEEEGEYDLVPDERPIVSENELKMFVFYKL
jgi:hypothetical protein